jgi:hypothetical protein
MALFESEFVSQLLSEGFARSELRSPLVQVYFTYVNIWAKRAGIPKISGWESDTTLQLLESGFFRKRVSLCWRSRRTGLFSSSKMHQSSLGAFCSWSVSPCLQVNCSTHENPSLMGFVDQFISMNRTSICQYSISDNLLPREIQQLISCWLSCFLIRFSARR